MSTIAVLLVLFALTVAGSTYLPLLATREAALSERIALAFIAGLTVTYPLWLAFDASGVGWWVLTLLASCAMTALVGRSLARRSLLASPEEGPVSRLRFGWGDALATATVSTVAVLAAKLWIVNPDFIYHWGIKGHRFYQHRGLDLAFLADPVKWHVHPDYPNLIPSLFAHTALVRGSFDESAMMLWTPIFVALIVIAVREGLARQGVRRQLVQATVAATALACAIFSIGFLSAGGADLPIALALVLAWPALAARKVEPKDDWTIALAAALAAASKIEGVPLAALLVTAHLLRPRNGGFAALKVGPLLRTVALPALVILPWLATGMRAGLFTSHARTFDWSRWPAIFDGLLHVAGQGALHGLPWLLLLLPLLFLGRRAARPTAVVALQLAFYLFVYLTYPLPDPDRVTYFAASNFGRLSFHLIPAILFGTALVLDRVAGTAHSSTQ